MRKLFLLKKVTLMLVISLIAMLVLTACGKSAEAPGPSGASQGTTPQTNAPVDLVFSADNISAANLDPQKSSVNDQYYLQVIYRSLLKVNMSTMEVEPDMAEKYQVSPDGLTYTFQIRKGVKFHKGFGDMTAKDVVFSYNRVVDAKTASKFAKGFSMVESVSAPDDYTVVYKLKAPFAPFPFLVSDQEMGAFILSEKAVTQYGDQFNKNPIGTGPFMLKEWIPQQSTAFASNPDYYAGAPKVNLTVREIKDGNTALMALQKGEIQAMTSTQLEIVNQAKSMNNIDVKIQHAASLYSMFMNVTQKPFDDVRVRQAVAYALDKDANRKALFGDSVAAPATGYIPSLIKGFTTEGLAQYPYNPEKAKQLLAEAGYPNGFSVVAKPASDPRNTRIWTLIQENLSKVGIKVELEPVAAAQWSTWQYSGKAAMGYFPMNRVPEIYFLMNGYYNSNSKPPQGPVKVIPSPDTVRSVK